MSSNNMNDPRRQNKIFRYKPPTTENNPTLEDPTPDYMNLLGMIFSMCGLMLKLKWCAWIAVYCSFISFANSRSSEDTKQMMSSFMFPTDPILKKTWESALGRERFSASSSTVLCSQHFEEADVDRTGQIVRIREGAVPSVFSFPAHLQKKPLAKRKTKTSQRAAVPFEVTAKIDVGTPESLPCDEHLYAAPPSPDRLKDKLTQAQARVEELQRQLRNAKDRERRCKMTLKSLLVDLKDRNLITEELKQKLGLYSGTLGNRIL
ncbi:ASTER protein, partial [Polypterus senegalus]